MTADSGSEGNRSFETPDGTAGLVTNWRRRERSDEANTREIESVEQAALHIAFPTG